MSWVSFKWIISACLLVGLVALPSRAAEQTEADKLLLKAGGLFHRNMHKLAADEYEMFLARYPKHEEATSARYALAICRYRLGELDKAVQQLTAVLADAKFQARDEALAVLGHCQLTLKDQTKALDAFERLLKEYPQSKHAEAAAVNRAQVLCLAGKHADTRAACEQFLRQYPDSAQRPTALYFLAISRSALADHAAAAEALTELATKHPNSPYQVDVMLLLGQSAEAQGKLEDAAATYRQLLKVAPPSRQPDARFSLALVLHKAGQYDEAARELSAMLSTAEGKASTYAAPAKLQLGLCQVALGRHAEARKILADVAGNDAERTPMARYGLALCDMAEGQYGRAQKTLAELSQANPPLANQGEIVFRHALCLMGLEKFDEAAQAFAQFRAAFPKADQAGESLYRQAFCLHKLQKYDQSHALCAQVDPKSPSASAAAELDAENLFLLKKYDEAAKAYAALADAEKDAARRLRFAVRRGQTVYFTGNYPAAAELLAPLAKERGVLEDPALREAVFLLGDSLLQQQKHAEAAEALARYVAASKGNHPEAQFKLALAQLRSSDAASAERTLEQLARASRNSEWTPRALLELAQLQVKQNRPEKAAEPLRRMLSMDPPEELAAPAMYLLGWIDFDAKKYAQSAAQFQRVLDKYPSSAVAADAAFQLGVAMKEAGQGEQAVAALQQYLRKHPAGAHAAEASQLLASAQVRLNKPEEAVKTLTALAADAKTRSAAVLYDLAWACRGMKNPASAIEAYRRLLNDYPADALAVPAAVEMADLLYQDARYADAAALLEKAMQGKADAKVMAAGLYRLGLCYEKLNEPAKAAAVFADFAQKHKDDELAASALYQAGAAHAGKEQFADAERQFAELVKRFPKHELTPTAMLKLGEMQNEQGNYDTAVKTFGLFIAAYPKDKFIHLAQFGVGWSYENRKRYDEARQWYGKVIAGHNGPTAARAQFQIGETFLKEGKFEQAVKELLAVEDVYASPQWSPAALYDAGQAFEQLKQNDLAVQQYRQIIQKYKESKVAELAQNRLKALGAGQ